MFPVIQERIRELERALEETKSEHRSPVPNNLSAEVSQLPFSGNQTNCGYTPFPA